MPVSKKRVKKVKKRGSKKSSDLVMFQHPFSGVPRDVLQKAFVEVGQKKADEFPRLLDDAKALCRSADPLLVIAMLVRYGLFSGVDNKGNFSKSYKGDSFNQSHVELVQAFLLHLSVDEISRNIPPSDVIQKYFDLFPELAETFHLRRFTQLGKERTNEEHAILLIQEELRLHTQVVRNWGFLTEVIQLVTSLTGPLDDMFEESLGVKATELIALFSHLTHRQQRLTNEHMEKMAAVFAEPTIVGALETYHRQFPDLVDSTVPMLAHAHEHKIPLKYMKYMLLQHADLRTAEAFTFNVETLAAETGFSSRAINEALNKLSISWGELEHTNPEFLFLANPVWTRPVIKVADGEFFCALPQVFFSFIFPILNSLLTGSERALKRYEKRRAEFLELEVRRLFEEAFPGCEIESGYRWREGADEYENDLMVRVDSHLILVEAKSHSISWEALRGAPDRAKRHVKEMLLDPSIQSLRLEKRVKQVVDDPERQEELLPAFPVALAPIKTVLRLSVTLEDFAAIQTTIHHARDANWIPAEHPIAPCMLLADLKIVFDILQQTPHKINYLKRRADFEAHAAYKGDELDLLGFYLKTGLNVGEAEFGKTNFMLTSMSQPIDKYYLALEAGVQTKKPVPKLTRWWSDICTRLEERGFEQWSDVANVLLGLTFEEQGKIEEKFQWLVSNVQRNWQVPEHLCAISWIPHKKKSDAIAIVAYKELQRDSRHEKLESIVSKMFEHEHVTRCLAIGVNIDKMTYPYSLIGVYFPS